MALANSTIPPPPRMVLNPFSGKYIKEGGYAHKSMLLRQQKDEKAPEAVSSVNEQEPELADDGCETEVEKDESTPQEGGSEKMDVEVNIKEETKQPPVTVSKKAPKGVKGMVKSLSESELAMLYKMLTESCRKPKGNASKKQKVSGAKRSVQEVYEDDDDESQESSESEISSDTDDDNNNETQ